LAGAVRKEIMLDPFSMARFCGKGVYSCGKIDFSTNVLGESEILCVYNHSH
jgi:hypothetical protein